MSACDDADRLQTEQCSLTARVLLIIPATRPDRDRESMDDIPWCTECKDS